VYRAGYKIDFFPIDQEKIPYAGWLSLHSLPVQNRLRKQLGKFLRERRGKATLDAYAHKLGISDSTLQRLEIGEQNITVDTLEKLLDRLGCDVTDIFKRG
jgi:DNA-binding Xre family transcriptional regulator